MSAFQFGSLMDYSRRVLLQRDSCCIRKYHVEGVLVFVKDCSLCWACEKRVTLVAISRVSYLNALGCKLLTNYPAYDALPG